MPKADAANFEKTVALGKEIARSLPENDVLGRWMAHYLSELIGRAESADTDRTRSEVCELIIKLWIHRSALPGENRPLINFEPIFVALERIGEPSRPGVFFPRSVPVPEEGESDNSIDTYLLDVATLLEETVQDVVRQIVIAATDRAAREDREWLDLVMSTPSLHGHAALDDLLDLLEFDAEAETSKMTEPAPIADRSRLLRRLRSAIDNLEGAHRRLEMYLRNNEKPATPS